MRFFAFAFIAVVSALSFNASAQEKPTVGAFVRENLPDVVTRNITEAERVYCYTVEMPYDNYQGYTIDQMAVTGFCGILNQQQVDILISAFLQNKNSLSEKSADCTIVPRILIRFLRGIDSTDMLFSSPCPSLTFFYGGGIKSFNAEPSAEQIGGVADLFEQSKIDFVSPTLLDQVFPIGVPQTEAQKALVAKSNAPKPSSKWNRKPDGAPEVTPAQAAPEQETKASGWNKININKK